MTIAIRCPNCDKAYNLKDELKGKRVACTNPNCKKVFTVEPNKASVPAAPGANGAKVAPAKAGNVEDLALAALAEEKVETKASEAAPDAKIKVKCQFCDHESLFDARMAGKNAPCQNEECRKIIKVPLPKKEDPKDWRNVQKRPSAAKVDAPDIEGAWGNVQTTAVSREALVEAEANRVEEREPRSWAQIIKISLVAAAVLLLLVVGTVWMLKRRGQGKQEDAMKKALAFTDPKSEVKLTKEQAALINMLAGEYDLAKERPIDAKNKFVAARGGIDQTPTPERCALLTELACLQAGLAGKKEEAAAGKRLDWEKDKVNSEVRSTLSRLDPKSGDELRDMRSYAFRRLTHVLAPAGNVAGIEATANAVVPLEDRGEILAVVGLELLAMGLRDEAERIAKQASQGSVANSSSLIALWLALGGPDAAPEKAKVAVEKARAVAPPPGGQVLLTPLARAGYAAGYARQGRIKDGRDLAALPGSPEDRLRAMAAVAAAVVQSKKGDITDLEQCAKLVEAEVKARPDAKWLLFRLVQLSLQAGNPRLAGRFANFISDNGLRAWARYEIFRDKLASGNDASVEEAMAIIGEKPPDKFDPPARWLAVVALMQHKAAAASKGAATSEIAAMPAGPAQAFGYAGVALSEK
jgi:hypothetical protein